MLQLRHLQCIALYLLFLLDCHFLSVQDLRKASVPPTSESFQLLVPGHSRNVQRRSLFLYTLESLGHYDCLCEADK